MQQSTFRSIRNLIVFLAQNSNFLRSPVFLFVVIASGSRTALIYLINNTAAEGAPTITDILLLVGIAVTLLFFSHQATLFGVKLVQQLLFKLRTQLSARILSADVGFFQRKGHGELYHAFSHHAVSVSETALRLVDVVQAFLILIFCLAYMFIEMPSSVLATLIAVGLGVTAFFIIEGPADRAVGRVHWANVAFHNSLNDILRGYKELRLRLSRRRAISDRMADQIKEAADATYVSHRYYSLGQVSATGALLALLIAIVIILPTVGNADGVTTLQILTLVLFSFGPIEAMVGGLPAFARAAISLRLITELSDELEKNAEAPVPADAQESMNGFKRLELRGIKALLTRDVGEGSASKDTFTLGPVDLTLIPGQSVFITGGNGMGKSTLLQLLTGLRHPDAGTLLLDGKEITRETVAEYRSVFSAVFSEFHLFRHLDGMDETARSNLLHHIEEMGIAESVSLDGDEFAELQLSTGQMRRLALSLALAEERPIIVLDEFAADQDPTRRAYFYDVLVPRLARQGHCVVAVTHDEHCFGKADRLIRMEDGKIVSDTIQNNSDARETVSTSK